MQVKKQQLEVDMIQQTDSKQTDSKLRKEFIKAVYCYPDYLTYMQSSIMWNVRLVESQVGIKIARRNINNVRYADDTTPIAESEEELKSFLMWLKEEHEKPVLNSTFKKLTSWHLSHHFMANRWRKIGNSDRFYFLRLQKDTCSLEGRLWQT